MSDQPVDIIVPILRDIQEAIARLEKRQENLEKGQAEIRAELAVSSRKTGVIAENVHHIRQDVHGMRSELQLVALAVDEHSHRLNDLEDRPPPSN